MTTDGLSDSNLRIRSKHADIGAKTPTLNRLSRDVERDIAENQEGGLSENRLSAGTLYK